MATFWSLRAAEYAVLGANGQANSHEVVTSFCYQKKQKIHKLTRQSVICGQSVTLDSYAQAEGSRHF